MQKHLIRANGKKVPRCQEPSVPDSGGFRFYQCKKAAMAGGRFCKQHDPDEIKKRDQVKQAEWDCEWQKRRVQLYGPKFMRVLEQIAAGHNDPRALAQKTLDEFNR